MANVLELLEELQKQLDEAREISNAIKMMCEENTDENARIITEIND